MGSLVCVYQILSCFGLSSLNVGFATVYGDVGVPFT